MITHLDAPETSALAVVPSGGLPLARTVRDPLFETSLTAEARKDLDYWRGLLMPAMRQRGRGLTRTLQAIAVSGGQSFKTVKGRYYAWKKHGVRGLVDKRLAGPLFWKVKGHRAASAVSQSRGIQQLWCALCEANQRKSKGEFNTLVKMWKERDPRIAAIPEYEDFPGWPALPQGWTYPNLMRYGPDDFDLTSARVGRAAAALERRRVYTTRVGLWVGSHYLFDDKWNDLFVNSFADGQAGRPLEIYSLDLFSAKKLCNATRVRTKDQEGNYTGVAGIMARYVLAATLYLKGYSKRGTVLVMEHGTATEDDAKLDLITEITGGLVTWQKSGMSGDTAHLGQYPLIERGNPRHKAALESNNNLEHNRRGALPGQTGRSIATRPEQLDGKNGLLKYNSRLLAAREQLPPEKAALLDFPLLELNQYLDVASHIDAAIADDRDHELEGWLEAGNVVQAIQLGGQEILETKLTPEQRAALPALLDAGLVQARPVRMSRREVWERGAGDLIKLPGWGVVAILGDDLARDVTVVDDMISMKDNEWWPGILRFETDLRDAEGRHVKLREGQKFQAFINPFASNMLFVRDLQGRYLGECRRIIAPCRSDMEAVRRAMGEAAAAESELLTPLVARHTKEAKEKLDRHSGNAAVMDDSGEKKRALTAAQQERNKRRSRQMAAAANDQV